MVEELEGIPFIGPVDVDRIARARDFGPFSVIGRLP